MKDEGNYARLFGIIFISIIGFLLSLLALFFLMRLIFGLFSYIPWMVYVYTIFILSVPAAIFITAYTIFLKRTRNHPAGAVKILSYLIFGVFLSAWSVAFILDIINFFKKGSPAIENYYSWNMPFLSASVAFLFIVGVMQALTAKKEEDWLDKYK